MTRCILDNGAEQLPCTTPDHQTRARAGSSVRVHRYPPINKRACFSALRVCSVLATPPSVYLAGTGPPGSVNQGPVPGPVPGPAGVHVPPQGSLQKGQLLLRETAAAAAEPISAVDGSCEKGLLDYIWGGNTVGEVEDQQNQRQHLGEGAPGPFHLLCSETRRAAVQPPPSLICCSLLNSGVELFDLWESFQNKSISVAAEKQDRLQRVETEYQLFIIHDIILLS